MMSNVYSTFTGLVGLVAQSTLRSAFLVISALESNLEVWQPVVSFVALVDTMLTHCEPCLAFKRLAAKAR